jgi:hypothetical protein
MMKKIILLIWLSTISITAICQEQPIDNKLQYKNSIQFDVGGHGLFYSLNYERILLNGNNFKTAAQAGISYYPASTGIRDVWIPISINELYTIGNHHIEFGLGIVPIREAARDADNNPRYWFWSGLFSGRIGYRYQKPGGRFLFRAGFTPVVESGLEYTHLGESMDRTYTWVSGFREFIPLAGVSIGYAF